MTASEGKGSFFEFPKDKNQPLISGHLYRKPPKQAKASGWKQHFFVLTPDGKFSQSRDKRRGNISSFNLKTGKHGRNSGRVQEQGSNLEVSMSSASNLEGTSPLSKNVTSSMFLQQRTKIYTSEFREHCFEICTPSQRKIVLAASSEKEKLQWIEALKTACRNSPPRTIKICLVGNDKELQQRLLYAFFSECNQQKLADDVLNYSYKADNVELTLNLEVTEEKVKLVLCCVCAQDLPNLRVLHYVDANAFMLCYSATKPSQFDEIETVWYPEVKTSIEKGASLFLIGLHDSTEEAQFGGGKVPQVIDRDVGEEFSGFIGAAFFDVDMNFQSISNEASQQVQSDFASTIEISTNQAMSRKKKENGLEEGDVNSLTGELLVDKSELGGEGEEFDSPAETFLDVLQATIEDADGSIIDDSTATTDVANMDDFNTSFLSMKSMKFAAFAGSLKRIKASNFLGFVKKKTKLFSDVMRTTMANRSASLSVASSSRLLRQATSVSDSGTKRGRGGGLDPETIGTLKKLKAVLKRFKPRSKTRKERLPKLGEDQKEKAHYVSRTMTGSLIFLGEDYLDTDTDSDIGGLLDK